MIKLVAPRVKVQSALRRGERLELQKMFNAALILILALHVLPYVYDFSEYLYYDLYDGVNLLIPIILAACVYIQQTKPVTKFISFVILVVSVLFLLNFIIETAIDIASVKPVYSELEKWQVKD